MSMAYTGPHLIVNRADKYFTILMNGKKQRVTVDRLKTAHLLPLGISDSTEEEKKVQLGPQKLKSEITGQQTRPKRRVNMPIRYGNPHLYSIKDDQGNWYTRNPRTLIMTMAPILGEWYHFVGISA